MSEPLPFARPLLLLLVLLPLVARPLYVAAARRTARRWQSLGDLAQLRNHVISFRPATIWKRLLFALVLVVLCVALAGPRWGKLDEHGVAIGRDIIITLDLSRSMWAEDILDRDAPTRWQAAVHGAKDLVNRAKLRGGDRIGLVIFAAQPLTIAPLTTDYDHLLLKLDSINAYAPPAEIRPASDDAASGTRIGAALQAAVDQHDPRFPGFQEIVLFTDADDPAEDVEWRQGVTAARAAGIPVQVVGIGDPDRDAFILKNGEPLEGPLGQVLTRLRESVTQPIATESRGEYYPARTGLPDMQSLDRAIQSDTSREVSDERLPQSRDRSHLFYLVVACGLSQAWFGFPFWRSRSMMTVSP